MTRPAADRELLLAELKVPAAKPNFSSVRSCVKLMMIVQKQTRYMQAGAVGFLKFNLPEDLHENVAGAIARTAKLFEEFP